MSAPLTEKIFTIDCSVFRMTVVKLAGRVRRYTITSKDNLFTKKER